ncbi:glutathione S-transferase N-terminal domain-containing protein [Pendulispora brunnea]|uniref:Glutathione S-transferase N-terminal domain-containing protein n=1 Tax=Pendulispora brunnea TaxID=2905690 RepID=A0ABZ2JXZ0_9BACT
MRITWSSTSPFVRKVIVFAVETGLDARIERMPIKTSPTTPSSELSKYNPLTKLPALQTDEGTWLYDSPVICEYLDTLHAGPPMVPREGAERFEVLRLQALSDGLVEAGLLCRYESLRPPAHAWHVWTESQLGKVQRALDSLEIEARDGRHFSLARLHLGQIAVACALGWLDFRGVAGNFRENRPNLAKWYMQFSARPSMTSTVPHDE